MKSEVWHEDNIVKEPELLVDAKSTRCQLVWSLPVRKNPNDPELEKPFWWQGVIFGALAEEVAKRCHQGDCLRVFGRLNANRYRGKDDGIAKASVHMIVFKVYLITGMSQEPIAILAPRKEKLVKVAPGLPANKASEAVAAAKSPELSGTMQDTMDRILNDARNKAAKSTEDPSLDPKLQEFLGQAAPFVPGRDNKSEESTAGDIPF